MDRGRVSVAQARAIAGNLLGAAPEGVERYAPLVGGDDSHGFCLRLDGRRLLLKVKREPGTPIGIPFYDRLRAADLSAPDLSAPDLSAPDLSAPGLPVPELLAFSPRAGPAGEACAVWAWVEGRPATWEAGQPCPYDEMEFGQLLRRIHELRFDGPFGLLGDDLGARTYASHPDLGPVSETWPGFFHCDRAARRYREMGYLSRAEAQALSGLPGKLAPLFAHLEPRLLHMGDIMHNGNMIVGPDGRIRAVVDFCESMAGAPRWELAWVDFYFDIYPFDRRPFDMARFRAGYGTDHDPHDEVGRFYTLAILVFEKLLFFRPETPRGAWAIEAVKELLKSFG